MRHRNGAFTLVEMMIALVIVAVLGVAVSMVVIAGGDGTAYVKTSNDTILQVDNACRRMTFNVRMAGSIDAPTTSTPTSGFTIHTQQDGSNGSYKVVYGLDVNNNLTEADDRFGTNTLVSNVTTFSVTRQTSSAPSEFQITVTAGTNPVITRTFTIVSRNL